MEKKFIQNKCKKCGCNVEQLNICDKCLSEIIIKHNEKELEEKYNEGYIEGYNEEEYNEEYIEEYIEGYNEEENNEEEYNKED